MQTILALENRQLFRGVLSESQVPRPLSAASLQASRLAACEDGSFVFASGSNVFKVECSPSRKRARSPSTDNTTDASGKASDAVDASENKVVSEAIADDYMVPKQFSSLHTERYISHCTHQSEIHSVTADDHRVASVDAYGKCVITVANAAKHSENPDEKREQSETDCFVLNPVSVTNGAPGWAGVALKSGNSGAAVIGRHFFRDLTLFDRDVPTRTIHSLLRPASLGFTSESVVAVAEGASIALYDFRTGERGACIGRKSVGSRMLLSLDVSKDGGILAAAGMDRVVHIFDVRSMAVRDRWSGCLKYECAGVLLSREMEGMAYVCSVDNEISCGAWSEHMAEKIKLNLGESK